MNRLTSPTDNGRVADRYMNDALVKGDIEGTNRLELRAERASIEGLAVDSAYTADLDAEIEATTSAYVGAAVTEIAIFRAEPSGPQVG